MTMDNGLFSRDRLALLRRAWGWPWMEFAHLVSSWGRDPGYILVLFQPRLLLSRNNLSDPAIDPSHHLRSPTPPLSSGHIRATHARPLCPAALASTVPSGIALAFRVRVSLALAILLLASYPPHLGTL